MGIASNLGCCMRALVIDEGVQDRIREVLYFAMAVPNHYRPFEGKDTALKIPGDDPRYVALVPQGYKAVFTLTEDREGKLWRHLSVSVPGGKYPNPFAVWTIATKFGFEGWDGISLTPPKNWVFNRDDGAGKRCVVVGTRYAPCEP